MMSRFPSFSDNFLSGPRFWRNHLLLPGALMLSSFSALEAFGLDRPIAHAFFYTAAQRWIGAGAGDLWAHQIIHDGGRWLPRSVGAAALFAWIASFLRSRFRPWRRTAGFIFLAIAVSVTTVGVLKLLTNVDCPWDLSGFGGDRPYVALFAHRPDWLPRAECFPGAHASSGFALVCLYFVLRDRSRRLAHRALLGALGIGIVFSIGQEARGAHFLSHDLAAAGIVWLVQLLLYAWLLRPAASGIEARDGVSQHAAREAADDVA
jgi:membrane-associated PAP2 superfamily phosphatase